MNLEAFKSAVGDRVTQSGAAQGVKILDAWAGPKGAAMLVTRPGEPDRANLILFGHLIVDVSVSGETPSFAMREEIVDEVADKILRHLGLTQRQ
jgi:hypothetical protein